MLYLSVSCTVIASESVPVICLLIVCVYYVFSIRSSKIAPCTNALLCIWRIVSGPNQRLQQSDIFVYCIHVLLGYVRLYRVRETQTIAWLCVKTETVYIYLHYHYILKVLNKCHIFYIYTYTPDFSE